MCCFFAALALLGPRFGFLVFWLFPYGQLKISTALNGWFWPLLGLIFLPWTTLAYVLLFPVVSFDWIWLGIAFVADIATIAASGSRRMDVSWYTGP